LQIKKGTIPVEETNQEALVLLTEKIVESGGRVSSTMSVMSDNVVELAEIEKRIESKVGKLRKETLICHQETLEEFTTQMKRINGFLDKIDETGIINLIKTLKRLAFAISASIIGAISWLVLNSVLKFYVDAVLRAKGAAS